MCLSVCLSVCLTESLLPLTTTKATGGPTPYLLEYLEYCTVQYSTVLWSTVQSVVLSVRIDNRDDDAENKKTLEVQHLKLKLLSSFLRRVACNRLD
jgi:hypothetical protein